MTERISATTDEKEAVKLALEFEREGYRFYRDLKENAASDMEKRLFEILASEEEVHYKLLENTHRFLEDTGDWFMWEELGLLEG